MTKAAVDQTVSADLADEVGPAIPGRQEPTPGVSQGRSYDIGWAERRQSFRARLHSGEWLLAMVLYLLFAVLAATAVLT